MPAAKVPLEDEECFVFHQWLEMHGIPHEHVPNESRSSKRDAAIRGRKLKKMGVSKGFWDYAIFVPVYDCEGKLSKYELIMVEMKRQRGSSTSKEQKEWGEIYEKTELPHEICKGAKAAIEFVKEATKEISEKSYEILFSDETVF